MSTKGTKLLHHHKLLFESTLILNDLSDQVASIKSLADEEDSRTTRKIGAQLKFVLQIMSILNKTLQESIRLAGNSKLSDQTISQMRSATTVELKKLEALSGGAKRKFAFEYRLEQLINKIMSQVSHRPRSKSNNSLSTPSQQVMQLTSLIPNSHQMMVNYILYWRLSTIYL
jgi:hypothetical protein